MVLAPMSSCLRHRNGISRKVPPRKKRAFRMTAIFWVGEIQLHEYSISQAKRRKLLGLEAALGLAVDLILLT